MVQDKQRRNVRREGELIGCKWTGGKEGWEERVRGGEMGNEIKGKR